MAQGTLTPRLATIFECIAAGNCNILADIGTDHAHLPIEAVRTGLCARAIACDISPGPLKSAKINIQAAKLEGRIETRLGDGLLPLKKNEADCIVIAGMGGKRICGILENSREKVKKIILQPQHDLEELRRFLHSKGYTIKDEMLAREKERFYVILYAESTGEITSWTEAEYFLGKILPENIEINPDIRAYFQEKHKKISGYICSVKETSARRLAEKQLSWLQRVLKEA